MARPTLPTSVAAAIVVLWISVGLAIAVLIGGRLTVGSALAVLGWTVAYAGAAVGLQKRLPAAWMAGVAVSGLAYLIGLLSLHQVLSTSLLILVALLFPSSRRAVTAWRMWRGPGVS